MEVRGEVADLGRHGNDLGGPGQQHVEEHAGAEVVDGAGGVQRDDAGPAGGVTADQGRDAAQDGGGRAHVGLREAGQQEGQASVGCGGAGGSAAELKRPDVRAKVRDGGTGEG